MICVRGDDFKGCLAADGLGTARPRARGRDGRFPGHPRARRWTPGHVAGSAFWQDLWSQPAAMLTILAN